MTFSELIDELKDRSSEELAQFAELVKKYAIERRREEIADNISLGREEWRSGRLVASDDINELMQSLEDVE